MYSRLFAVLIVLFACIHAYSQNAGQVAIQTVGPTPVLTNVNTPGQCSAANVIPNIGAGCHLMKYCPNPGTGTISLVEVDLEASDDGITWTRISDLGQSTSGCAYITAGSYYPNLRECLLNFGFTGNATISTTYSGSATTCDGNGFGTVLARRQATIPAIQSNSAQNGTSFSSSTSGNAGATNPGANTHLLDVFFGTNASKRTVYMDKVIVQCTATCTFDVVLVTAAGSGCTSPTIINTNLSSPFSSLTSGVFPNTCGVAPTIGNTVIPPMTIVANTPVVIDLSAFVIPSSTNKGLGFRNSTALTGRIDFTPFWYER